MEDPNLMAKKGKIADPHAAREAARYDNPIPSREVILELLTAAEKPLDRNQIAVLDVPSIFAQVYCNTVRSGLFDEDGGLGRSWIRRAANLTQRRDMVDIDAKMQWLWICHLKCLVL